MFHAVVTSHEETVHLTKHRTQAAAARSLSKAITASTRLPDINCGVVTDGGQVMSLREAQRRTGLVATCVAARLRRAAGVTV